MHEEESAFISHCENEAECLSFKIYISIYWNYKNTFYENYVISIIQSREIFDIIDLM